MSILNQIKYNTKAGQVPACTNPIVFAIQLCNPEALTNITEEESYTILGGSRVEGLYRLRVTIKIEVTNRKFQHYLNNPDIAALTIRKDLELYRTQVEKLARLIVELLEAGVKQVI